MGFVGVEDDDLYVVVVVGCVEGFVYLVCYSLVLRVARLWMIECDLGDVVVVWVDYFVVDCLEFCCYFLFFW